MDGFTLNGLRSDTDLGIVMGQVVKPIAPTMSVVTEDVPAKYGVNYEGTNYQSKTITIPYTVLNYNSQDSFNSAIQNLAAQLIRPELGSQEYALVFDDEPDKTYIGHVSAIDAPTFTNTGVYDFSGNITFEMSDPRAYLPLVELPIDNRVNRSDNLAANTGDLSRLHIVDNLDGTTTGKHTTSGSSATVTNSDKTAITLHLTAGYNFQANQSVTIAVDASCTGTATVVFGYFDGQNWENDSEQFPLTGTTQRIIFRRVLSSVNGDPQFSVNILCKNGIATVGSIKLATDEDDDSFPDMTWSPAAGEDGYYKYTSGYDITVDGTAPADPVLSIIPKRDLTHAGFMLNGGNFGVGTDDDVQQPNVQSPYTEIIEDNAGSISEWSNDAGATSSITTATGFTAQSSMTASTDGSSVLNVARNKDGTYDFGNLQQSGWYGPLYRYQGISASLPYYKISAMIHHKIYTGIHNLRAMGDIEFLLLDGNGQSFGRFAIKSQSGGHVPYAIMQIGTSGSRFSSDSDHYTLYNGKGVSFTDKRNVRVRLPTTIKTGKKKRIQYITVVNAENTSALTDAWLEFTLEHTVKNSVPVFNWSITQYNLKTGLPYQDKHKHLIVSGQYVDSGNRFGSSLGSVGLGMWKMAITEDTTTPAISYRNCYMSLTGMSIYQVNQTQLEPTKPKQIAKAGQELILDCAADRATVDGHEISPTWTTTFPKFKHGANEIALAGDIADADVTLSYYPRTY